MPTRPRPQKSVHQLMFFACDVVGDGSEANPYRPAIADHVRGDAATYIYPASEKGVVDHTLVLCLLNGSDSQRYKGLSGVFPVDRAAARRLRMADDDFDDNERSSVQKIGKRLNNDFDISYYSEPDHVR